MIESVELLRVRTRNPGGSNWIIPAYGEAQYCDADVPVVVGGASTYEPLQWTRGEISSALIDARADLEIVVPQDCELAVALRPMSAPWRIEVLRATGLTRDDDHIDVVTATVIAVLTVSGLQARRSGAAILCRSPRAALDQMGPRGRFSETCRHMLYGAGCGLNRGDWTDSGLVTAVAGDVITAGLVSAAAFLVGGVAEVAGQVRLIVGNAGDGTCRVNRAWSDPVSLVGETLTCVPGCKRTTSDCDTKFGNLANFGGLPTAQNPWSRRKTWGEQ